MVFKRGRNPFLILEFAFDQAISRGAIGNDVGFAHDARVHAQRLEDAVMQEIAVELAGDAMDENAQRQISEIAVGPLRARRERRAAAPRRFSASSSSV